MDKGDGTFEPRRVETGWRRGGLVEITRGLMNKERIVVSGTFMIDSESRMQAAAMGIYDEGVMDPVCGMYIDEKKAKASGRMIKFGGADYYFCSSECRQDFEKVPRRYLGASGERSAKATATAAPVPMTYLMGNPSTTTMAPAMAMPMTSTTGTRSTSAMEPATAVPTIPLHQN